MKKFTTIIAITLLAALLFTGCDLIPLKKDFSDYGFTFTIAGEVTEKEGNEFGSATLYTKIGTLEFSTAASINIPVLGEISWETYIAKECPNKTTLENGGRLYVGEAKDNGSGILVVESHYFVENGDTTWHITSTTPKNDFDQDALERVLESIKFVTAE